MRIVGGELGGRRFPGPPADVTRPTSERVREALASALGSRGAIDGSRVLDLFTGTGALAFEALSRGAREAVLIDRDPRVIKAAKESAKRLGLGTRTHIRRSDLLGSADRIATQLLPLGPFDLVFADPPYARIESVPPLLDELTSRGVIDGHAWVVVEFARAAPLGDCRYLAPMADYRYGDTSVRLLRPPSASVEAEQER